MYNGTSYTAEMFPAEHMKMQQPQYQYNAAQAYLTPPASPQPQYLPAQDYQQRNLTHLEQYIPNIVQEKVLGTGAYGTVYLVQDITTGARYACKALNKFIDGRPVDIRTQQFQHTELELHYEASAHPNVVSLLKVVDTPTITYVFLEYCPEGDLFANITEYQRYQDSPREAKAIFLQILDAVRYCHSRGIYHRDLKPENILVSHNGTQAKLADFGLATTERSSTDFGCGSTFYMSPECHDVTVSGSSYSTEANDIWSLGVILVNLTCGRNPWKVADARRDSTYKAFRNKPDFLKEILPISDDLNDILKRIFTQDPTQRIGLQELHARVYNCMAFSNVEAALLDEASQQYYNMPVYQVPYDVFDESLTTAEYVYGNRSTGSYSSAHSTFSDASSASIPQMQATSNTTTLQPYVLPSQTSLASTVASWSGSFISNCTNRVTKQGLGMHLFVPIFHAM